MTHAPCNSAAPRKQIPFRRAGLPEVTHRVDPGMPLFFGRECHMHAWNTEVFLGAASSEAPAQFTCGQTSECRASRNVSPPPRFSRPKLHESHPHPDPPFRRPGARFASACPRQIQRLPSTNPSFNPAGRSPSGASDDAMEHGHTRTAKCLDRRGTQLILHSTDPQSRNAGTRGRHPAPRRQATQCTRKFVGCT